MRIQSTLVLFIFCLAGTQGRRLSRQAVIPSEDEIDNISDSSSDIIYRSDQPPLSMDGDEPEQPAFDDPKVYGMNIGLHFILEDINRRITTGDRVHLESLIKVLVITHNIEKVGGFINDSNKMALKHASELYPAALKDAIRA